MRYLGHLVMSLALLSLLAACADNPSPSATDPTLAATTSGPPGPPAHPPSRPSRSRRSRRSARPRATRRAHRSSAPASAWPRSCAAIPPIPRSRGWSSSRAGRPASRSSGRPATPRASTRVSRSSTARHVVIREGDFVDGACVTRGPDVMSLDTGLSPFASSAARCRSPNAATPSSSRSRQRTAGRTAKSRNSDSWTPTGGTSSSSRTAARRRGSADYVPN